MEQTALLSKAKVKILKRSHRKMVYPHPGLTPHNCFLCQETLTREDKVDEYLCEVKGDERRFNLYAHSDCVDFILEGMKND